MGAPGWVLLDLEFVRWVPKVLNDAFQDPQTQQLVQQAKLSPLPKIPNYPRDTNSSVLKKTPLPPKEILQREKLLCYLPQLLENEHF